MSSDNFDLETVQRLRRIAAEDAADAYKTGAAERVRRAVRTPLGRLAVVAGGVLLAAGTGLGIVMAGGHAAGHEATHRSAATAESQSMRKAISRAIDPTMTTIANAALRVHSAHPGSAYIEKPDGKGGGTVEITYWTSYKNGTVTSIDVVMGLQDNKPDASNVLFADIQAPSNILSAANVGNSDRVWFASANGKKYVEGRGGEPTADSLGDPWSGPAAYSQSYLGPNHGVTTDTTSQIGLAISDSGDTLSPSATAKQITQIYTPLILEKISNSLD